MKLEVKGVSKSFEDKHILKDINLTLQEGELVCLLGASGGGKTTLFHIISGLLHPEQGSVWLDEKEITDQPGRVSYMLQKDMLLPYKTVLDNVALPLVIRGEKKKAAREEAWGYFEEFGLKGYEKKYPSQLSGGMRQRAALLRTYLFSGEVALLDEPFSALDTITRGAMHQWYLSVMEQIRLSTLFITHDVEEAIFLSKKIYIITETPMTHLEAVEVPEGYPRDRGFLRQPDVERLKAELTGKLRKQVM